MSVEIQSNVCTDTVECLYRYSKMSVQILSNACTIREKYLVQLQKTICIQINVCILLFSAAIKDQDMKQRTAAVTLSSFKCVGLHISLQKILRPYKIRRIASWMSLRTLSFLSLFHFPTRSDIS